jgi:iron complex transport system ATP-binding protein
MLEARELSSGYGKQKVLHNVSFTVEDGLLVGILGPNGSGKSTLIRTFFGIAHATAGQILLDGRDILKMRPEEVSRFISVQKTSKPSGVMLTVSEFVALGLDKPDAELVQKTLEQYRLIELAGKPVSQISDGQYQRASLAQASIKKPRLFLLDEPTSHLDIANKHHMLLDLKSRLTDGSMAMAIIHDIDIAKKYCDKIVLMGCGTIVDQGSVSLLDDPVITKKLYGLDIDSQLM